MNLNNSIKTLRFNQQATYKLYTRSWSIPLKDKATTRKTIPDITRRYHVRGNTDGIRLWKTRDVPAKRVNNGRVFLWELNSRINHLFARSSFMRRSHFKELKTIASSALL